MKQQTLKRFVTALFILAAGLVFADAVVPTNAAPRRRGRPARSARPSGGIVEKPYAGNVVRILDLQRRVPAEVVSTNVVQMRLTSLLPFELCDAATRGALPAFPEKADYASCAALATALAATPKTGAAVLLVDAPALPWMLVAPESRWVILNVAPLVADAPAPERLATRFTKVLWCAGARVLGAGYSSYPGCVLTPFSTVRELDAIFVTRPCPEPFNKMIDTGAKFGISTITIASYRTACQKGWAPPPANDVQRAVWDEVHSEKERGPVNGLKIPPPKPAAAK